MTQIKDLQPQEVWRIFDQMLQIPRPSNKEEKIQAWAEQFGKNLGLETIKDKVGNVIIKKPATKGMEDRKGVVLQGHLDMVPQKNNDTEHDFEKDPIKAYVDGDWVTAEGTTLGADNGVGASSILAILASKDIEHGPIEALLTATEETGMDGAEGLEAGVLDGDILINTDTEDEGVFSVGCAGGVDVIANFELDFEDTPKGMKACVLTVKGLKGGHSGLDIGLGRANANKLFFRIVNELIKYIDVRISDIQGGSLRNAIPRETYGTVLVKEEDVDIFKNKISVLIKELKVEYKYADEGLEVTYDVVDTPQKVYTRALQENLTRSVIALANGVVRMSDTMKGTVETSTNLAIVKANDKTIEASCLVRSFSESAKGALADRLVATFLLAGANVLKKGSYPGWQPNMDSDILEVMKKLYKEQFGKDAELLAMHAGLECGILGSIYTNWDMISIGPTIKYPHSPDEKVNIETVQKYWDFLLNVLKNIPKK